MFYTYDMSQFSSKIKELRKIMGFTITDVSLKTGISESTIKLLEKGKSVPRIDTVYFLSKFYKFDLFHLLNYYHNDYVATKHEALINAYILNANDDALKRELAQMNAYLGANKNFMEMDYQDIEQLQFCVEGLIKTADRTLESHLDEALSCYFNAMLITNSNFKLECFSSYKYYGVEYNILFAIANVLGLQKKCLLSNEILIFLLAYYTSQDEHTSKYKLILSKCYYLLAYNCHRLDFHEEAFQYASLGIEYCVSNDTMYFLPHLMFRKGVAALFNAFEGWDEPIVGAIHLLDIQKSFETKRLFEKSLNDYRLRKTQNEGR